MLSRITLRLAVCFSLPATAADLRVIDGDTFVLNGETIRVENIDTPEIRRAQCDAERRLGLVAKWRVETILTQPGAKITLQRFRKDRWDRTIARVSVNGLDLGEILITENMARPWRGRREPWCE